MVATSSSAVPRSHQHATDIDAHQGVSCAGTSSINTSRTARRPQTSISPNSHQEDGHGYRFHRTWPFGPGDGPAHFSMPLAMKNIRSALAAAEARSVPTPVASLMRDRLIEGIAREGTDFDWAGLTWVVGENAGLQGSTRP